MNNATRLVIAAFLCTASICSADITFLDKGIALRRGQILAFKDVLASVARPAEEAASVQAALDAQLREFDAVAEKAKSGAKLSATEDDLLSKSPLDTVTEVYKKLYSDSDGDTLNTVREETLLLCRSPRMELRSLMEKVSGYHELVNQEHPLLTDFLEWLDSAWKDASPTMQRDEVMVDGRAVSAHLADWSAKIAASDYPRKDMILRVIEVSRLSSPKTAPKTGADTANPNG